MTTRSIGNWHSDDPRSRVSLAKGTLILTPPRYPSDPFSGASLLAGPASV
jgi:hypothetical protein